MSTLSSSVDVAVIGAGAAGIGAARRLLELGRSVVVLEARKRPGGRAWTVPTTLGLPVDLGCEWLHSADRNPLTALARRHGLPIDERLPDWGKRRRTGMTEAEADAYHDAWEAYEAELAALAGAGPDRPASEALAAGGRWNALLHAISTWANGVELDRLSIRDTSTYDDSGINWRVLAGYGTLIRSLATSLPIALDAAVDTVDWSGAGVRIATTRGTVEARAAIVTLPTPLIAEARVRFRPALPAATIDAAAGLPLGIANKLFLEILGGDAHPGTEDPGADTHVVGATDRTRTGSYQVRPHGWPMISAYFGGRLARELEMAGPEAMAAFAIDEVAGVLGSSWRRRLRPLASSAWAGDPLAFGSYSHALPGHAGDRAILARPVGERLFFAGEAVSPRDFSTAHGAFLSGIAAAEAAVGAATGAAAGVAAHTGALVTS